jgi:hypothetical protein
VSENLGERLTQIEQSAVFVELGFDHPLERS